MTLDEMIEKYNFQKQDNQVIIMTDFENIQIFIGDSARYCSSGTKFIRFLKESLLDEFPSTKDDFIDDVFFLPTHKCGEFEESLDDEEILGELKEFYNPEIHKSFNIGPTSVFIDTPIPNKQKGEKGTSLYGADAVSLEELLEAAVQILELNAMKNYKIAYGDIKEGIGLLERGTRERDTTPKSRHYHFWKFNEGLTGKKFRDISSQFALLKIEEGVKECI